MAKQNEETVYQKRTTQGYWVSMYFYKIPFDYYDDFDNHKYINAIGIGLRIGESKHHNERWFNFDPKFRGLETTGNGSLENLWTALQLLRKYEMKHPQTTIVVYADDERRYTAYKWLKRYGYIEYECNGEKCLVKHGVKHAS